MLTDQSLSHRPAAIDELEQRAGGDPVEASDGSVRVVGHRDRPTVGPHRLRRGGMRAVHGNRGELNASKTSPPSVEAASGAENRCKAVPAGTPSAPGLCEVSV